MQRRNILKALSAVVASAAIVTSFGAHADDKVIKVGTIGGPDAQIWEVVTKVAKREGLNVKVIEFNDYVQPNAALDAGDLDANSFQHQPYLDSQVKQRGYKIVSAGLTYISPLGVYSKKLKSLKDSAARCEGRRTERPVERKPRAAVAANAGRDQAEGRRGRERQ